MAMTRDDWKTVNLINEGPSRLGGLPTIARQVTETAREIKRARTAAGVGSILDFGGPAGSSIPSVLANNSAISSFLYTLSRADKLQLFRYFANHDTMVGRAIDLHTELPMSRVTIGPPKGESPRQNREITRIYEAMCERLNLLDLLLEIAREYNLCFPVDSLVWSEGGQQVPIGELRVGDLVLTRKGRYRPVLKIHERAIDEEICVIHSAGLLHPLRVTKPHRIFTATGEKTAEEIREGDILYYCPPGDEDCSRKVDFAVDRVERVRYRGKVRDLTVNEDSSYVVENATVHNCGDVYLWCHWDEELMEWDEVYCLPVEYCFHPDTHILLPDGQPKRISEVNVGDRVMTHDGTTRKVAQVFRNASRGKILSIKTDYLAGALRVTPEHPVYTLVDGEVKWDGNFSTPGSVGVLVKSATKKLEKVPAATLKVGDKLVFQPPVDEIPDPEITDDLAALMGWYMAEGARGDNASEGAVDGVHFFLHLEESEEAEEIRRLLERCFPPRLSQRRLGKNFLDWKTRTDLKPVRKPLDWYDGDCPVCGAPNYFLSNKGPDRRSGLTRRAFCKNCHLVADPRRMHYNRPYVWTHPHYHTKVIYNNQEAVDFFSRECGTGHREKALRERWLYLPFQQQRILLANYIRGDGHSEYGKRVNCSSSNYGLISQVRVMMARVGADPNWYATIAGKIHDISVVRDDPLPSTAERIKAYHLRVSSGTVGALGYDNPYWPKDWAVPSSTEPKPSLITYDILSIEQQDYFGDVFNLEVEGNHSLVAEGAACGQCHSIIHPFNRKKEIVFFAKPLVDTAAIRRITDKDLFLIADTDIERLYEALGDSVPEELKEALNYGEAVPLNTNWKRGSYCVHLARNRPPNQEYGEAYIERCMDTLLRLENLKNANFQISSRNMAPKHLITAPGTTEAQLNDLRAQVDLGLMENVDWPIVTNFEVIWLVIGASDRLLNTDNEYQTLRQDLATGLGTTVDMLTGASTYGGQRLTLESMNTSYLRFRDVIRNFVEKNLFRPVAFAKGHYTEEEIEMWPRVRPEDIEEGDILIEERDGHLRRKRNQVNVIWMHSTLRFNRISIRDNSEVYDQLFQLHQKGSLPVRYLLDLHNIDPEESSQALLEDIGTPRDPVFNDFMRALYTSTDLPQKTLNETDFMDRVMRGLKLNMKPAAPQPALSDTGGGFGGGLGGGFGGGGGGLGGGPLGDFGGGDPGLGAGMGPGTAGAVPGGPGGPGAEGSPGGSDVGAAPGVAASRRVASRRVEGRPDVLPGRVLDPAVAAKLREISRAAYTEGRTVSPAEVRKATRRIEDEIRPTPLPAKKRRR